MGSYELAKAADEDFKNIFDYGIDTFGLDQAMSDPAASGQGIR